MLWKFSLIINLLFSIFRFRLILIFFIWEIRNISGSRGEKCNDQKTMDGMWDAALGRRLAGEMRDGERNEKNLIKSLFSSFFALFRRSAAAERAHAYGTNVKTPPEKHYFFELHKLCILEFEHDIVTELITHYKAWFILANSYCTYSQIMHLDEYRAVNFKTRPRVATRYKDHWHFYSAS